MGTVIGSALVGNFAQAFASGGPMPWDAFLRRRTTFHSMTPAERKIKHETKEGMGTAAQRLFASLMKINATFAKPEQVRPAGNIKLTMKAFASSCNMKMLGKMMSEHKSPHRKTSTRNPYRNESIKELSCEDENSNHTKNAPLSSRSIMELSCVDETVSFHTDLDDSLSTSTHVKFQPLLPPTTILEEHSQFSSSDSQFSQKSPQYNQ